MPLTKRELDTVEQALEVSTELIEIITDIFANAQQIFEEVAQYHHGR